MMQCVTNVDVGGALTALLLSGGFLFVGINKSEEGIIKVYNLASGQNHQLPGHKVKHINHVSGTSCAFIHQRYKMI
jgi:hypothetical protein